MNFIGNSISSNDEKSESRCTRFALSAFRGEGDYGQNTDPIVFSSSYKSCLVVFCNTSGERN